MYCCIVWFTSCTAEYRKDLQQLVRAAEKFTGSNLAYLTDIYTGQLHKKGRNIRSDPTRP